MSTLARIDDLHISFGGVAAASGVSFTVNAGEFLAVIGPNGAGKTTALRMVARHPETRFRPHLLRRPRRDGAADARAGAAGSGFHTSSSAAVLQLHDRRERDDRGGPQPDSKSVARPHAPLARGGKEKAASILARIGLAEQADKSPRALPLGQRKRLEVARAIALDPKLLLLDEPLAGLSSAEAATMADLIRTLPGQGITVVLVEHNLGEVLRVADRLVVLDAGKVLAEGVPAEVMKRADVRQAYTGVV